MCRPIPSLPVPSISYCLVPSSLRDRCRHRKNPGRSMACRRMGQRTAAQLGGRGGPSSCPAMDKQRYRLSHPLIPVLRRSSHLNSLQRRAPNPRGGVRRTVCGDGLRLWHIFQSTDFPVIGLDVHHGVRHRDLRSRQAPHAAIQCDPGFCDRGQGWSRDHTIVGVPSRVGVSSAPRQREAIARMMTVKVPASMVPWRMYPEHLWSGRE
jgi:hypothetical protein